MGSLWFRLKCFLLGRKYFYAVDVADGKGDYTAEIEGYSKDGVVTIVNERIICEELK